MSAIIKALRNALDADPNNWENRLALIEAHLSAGQQDEAAGLLNEVEELPADEDSLMSAAKSYSLIGMPDEGQRIMQHVVDGNPANAEAQMGLAEMAHKAGDSATAMRHVITATSLDSTIEVPAELQTAYSSVLGGSSPAAAEEEPAVAVVAEPEPEEPVAVVAEEETEPEEEIAPVVPVALTPPGTEPEPEPATAIPAPDVAAEATTGSKTITLKEAGELAGKTTNQPGLETQVLESTPSGSRPTLKTDAPAPALKIERHIEEYDPELEEEAAHLREVQDAIAERRKSAMARDKVVSLTVTILIHAAVFLALGLVVMTIPRDVPPNLVAIAAPSEQEQTIEPQKLKKNQVRQTATSSMEQEVIASVSLSNISVPTMAEDGVANMPAMDVSFAPSMTFSDAMSSPDSMMMFGQKIEGKVLGVILDVSGSMAEFLPMVIREVDKNYKNAPIVYVNHAMIVGSPDSTRIYPIVEEEVLPHWPREWEKGNSPYWFLWHDLPRKAPQHSIDRLIKVFKERPNMFIARGGNNRFGAAAKFLAEQKIDSLYIFSDFEDFVDDELAREIGQSLGRKKVRTYVQPAAKESEHLHLVDLRIARRTLGRKLEPLTDVIRPKNKEPAPIAVVKKEPTPIPEGVTFATPRPERKGDETIHRGYWRHHEKYFPEELKIYEYPNMDLVLRGPECRAYLYLKDDDGYIQSPVVFGYHSYKQYLGTDERMHTRRRKFIKNLEEPKLENGEFVWNMLLEDEITFKVILWFKDDHATATYVAQKPPDDERDGAFIYFTMPPLAQERKDVYYGPDFPDGLNLDNVRLATTDNFATFYLPGATADRYEKHWNMLGFKRGHNRIPYNVLYRTLPSGVREITCEGPSFGNLELHARTTSNKLFLNARPHRADSELWEGFACTLVRPWDRRERLTKTEGIEFSVVRKEKF
ncbi:MAG: tetratricopeptide repeat protein [Verrucomicrobiales bacterium]|nr:tetratricopeptide repeat protein [Verrucomicrobiales bacterium]